MGRKSYSPASPRNKPSTPQPIQQRRIHNPNSHSKQPTTPLQIPPASPSKTYHIVNIIKTTLRFHLNHSISYRQKQNKGQNHQPTHSLFQQSLKTANNNIFESSPLNSSQQKRSHNQKKKHSFKFLQKLQPGKKTLLKKKREKASTPNKQNPYPNPDHKQPYSQPHHRTQYSPPPPDPSCSRPNAPASSP